jgi:hypothetical protein
VFSATLRACWYGSERDQLSEIYMRPQKSLDFRLKKGYYSIAFGTR